LEVQIIESKINLENQNIERDIVVGLITSTEYYQKIKLNWEYKYIISETAKKLSTWCWDYFDVYHEAPKSNIETIYYQKLDNNELEDKDALWLESILESLNEDFEVNADFNLDYLIDNTNLYFRKQKILNTKHSIEVNLENNNVTEAENQLLSYQTLKDESSTDIDVFDGSDKTKEQIRKAFTDKKVSLIKYQRALGSFLNHNLNRGAFIGFMGKAKIGKSNILLDIAFKGLQGHNKVAYFQAGDMNESQQLRRIAIRLAGKSDMRMYCEDMYVPVLDCQYNQLDTCDSDKRQSIHGVFNSSNEALEYDSLVTAFKDYPDYEPCRNCKDIKGAPWLKFKKATEPLTFDESISYFDKFTKRYKNNFRLSTYASKTLSIKKINAILKKWKDEGFIPDIILVDYVDILSVESGLESRHQQNSLWLGLRNISQNVEYNTPMVATVTQVASSAYNTELLSENDFSEDKRKFDHLTVMYGLNQTPEEKKIGIMRINEILSRESDFDQTRPVKVLQKIQLGKPVITSYY